MEKIKIDKIFRSKRKSLSLIIDENASLIVRAPIKMSLKDIEEFIFKKRSWILKKKKFFSENKKILKISKKFVDREKFLYLGKTYPLKFKDCNLIEIFKDSLYCPQKYKDIAKEKIFLWYLEKAEDFFLKRAEIYSKITTFKYKAISLSNAKKRWGSCSSKGSLRFNWRLIMAPIDIIDYVVVHELIHLKEKNHKSKFWNRVEKFFPEYKKQRRWLKDNGRFLVL